MYIYISINDTHIYNTRALCLMYICMNVWYCCVRRVNRSYLSCIRLLFGSSILKFHRRKGRDWFSSEHSFVIHLLRDWGWKRVDGKTWKEDMVILWLCVSFAAFLTAQDPEISVKAATPLLPGVSWRSISSKQWKSCVGRSASASHRAWQKRLAWPTHFQDMGSK